jgi:hypothetical protein
MFRASEKEKVLKTEKIKRTHRDRNTDDRDLQTNTFKKDSGTPSLKY